MHNELTKKDIQMMKEELDYRRIQLRPQLLDAVLPDAGASDGVQLYDRVTVFLEDEGDTEVYQVVTTMRQDALHGLISKESPLGKALLGRKVGETFHIQVNDTYGYDAVVKAIEKGADDGSVPLNRF